MLKLGKISQETLTSALEAQETSGGSRRLGSLLVEMGAITMAMQDAALLYQTCEALYDLCTWQVGYFQFDAQEVPERSGISIQVDTLLEEVDRRALAGERTSRSRSAPATTRLRGCCEITPDKMELLAPVQELRSAHRRIHAAPGPGRPRRGASAAASGSAGLRRGRARGARRRRRIALTAALPSG